MPEFRLSINGRDPVANEDDAAVPPLNFLRNELGLRGARFGHGLGLCGACAVPVDGVTARSCIQVGGVQLSHAAAATYDLMALLISRAIRRNVAKALERFKYRLEQDSTPSLALQSPLDAVP